MDYTKAFDCVDHSKLWKILKEMGIPDHLTCLLRNFYVGQETSVRTRHGTRNWFRIGKEYERLNLTGKLLAPLYAGVLVGPGFRMMWCHQALSVGRGRPDVGESEREEVSQELVKEEGESWQIFTARK